MKMCKTYRVILEHLRVQICNLDPHQMKGRIRIRICIRVKGKIRIRIKVKIRIQI
jgi:hypothetical protein